MNAQYIYAFKNRHVSFPLENKSQKHAENLQIKNGVCAVL